LLRAALRGTAAARTPRDAALAILVAAAEQLEADAGSIYLLDLRTGHYASFVEWPVKGRNPDQGPPAGSIAIPPERISTLEYFERANGEGTTDHPPAKRAGVVSYALRGETCLGAISLEGPEPAGIGADLIDDFLAAADLLVSVYEDAFALNVLQSMQEPLDYGRSDVDFFQDLGVLIALSSGMGVGLLREREGDMLRCLALWGLPVDPPTLEYYDLQPVSAYPPFLEAAQGKTISVNRMDGEELAGLRALPWFNGVGSFVATPVHAGPEIFGVLSLGARCPYDYAPLELHGFESIANAAGVAIANFRNSRVLSGRVGEFTEAGVAITAVEVASAARHEAVGYIDNCHAGLAQLWKKLDSRAGALQDEFEAISADLGQVRDALNKIKAATKPPERVWMDVNLQTIWSDACMAVGGRLGEERVSVQYNGPSISIHATPDWLRQVFLNLLLNSVDAFKGANRTGRRIELSVERPSARAADYTIVYRDNATGINFQRLRAPPEYEHVPGHQRVFEPGVTSKPGGSGFGLWLVRRILDDHRGSIDLVEYRNGVTFAIRLPKPEEVGRKRR
jgi:nitrogen-specific signal transduction histidine kinase